MPVQNRISINGVSIAARTGSVLLEAAELQGIEYPHDCRAGRCGTCLTRIRKGITVGGETTQPRMVLACQARILSDLKVEFDDLPSPQMVAAKLGNVVDLGPDVVELEVLPVTPLEILPGQYCRFTFRGFPTRSFSPTVPLAGRVQPGAFRLQIQRVPGGRVSSQFGSKIKTGHHLKIEGPFGTAFHRPNRKERLVLAARGTGFAPILAVADAALRENRHREIVLVAGARNIEQLYMPAALGRLSTAPNVAVIATAEEPQNRSRVVRHGPVAEHLPRLKSDDLIYVAGGKRLVEGIASLARTAGAQVHFDDFESSSPEEVAGGVSGILAKAASWLG